MTNGRDKLPWGDEWTHIDQAVHDEADRIKIAAKFLPPYGPLPEALTVPSDTVVPGGVLSVDEGATTPLVETWVEFTLTPQQVEREAEQMTAKTLAERATNLLCQAQDLLLFEGNAAVATNPLFTGTPPEVRLRSGPAGDGLLGFKTPLTQIETVSPLTPSGGQPNYGENTAGAVARAYAKLQAAGHYGPYALALPTVPYADTHVPLANTLIMPADRIKPLVTAGFFGSGTFPARTVKGKETPQGVMVSIGGNTMDLVVGRPPTVAFMQEDVDGTYRFRVFERFALRLKDPTAVIRLDFEPAAEAAEPSGNNQRK
ncbi:encapsulin [Halochromatium glycolicum]|uniref:Uncharacterized protein n=1 Tax=Halochromatium glycolicum TaxID=85075 RepID=A0AAJ0XBL0_9GAMM|nr:family 1 encapsulin nanocompartment shell protein [Halochromatium glycolicum]MBK1706057.1 hypothetical protein [Halochromatium glycolicum]